MALTPAQLLQLAKTQQQVQAEQMRELYKRLYLFIQRDFAHKEDINLMMASFSQSVDVALKTHNHVVDSTKFTTIPPAILTAPLLPVSVGEGVGLALLEIPMPLSVADQLHGVLSVGIVTRRQRMADDPPPFAPLPIS